MSPGSTLTRHRSNGRAGRLRRRPAGAVWPGTGDAMQVDTRDDDRRPAVVTSGILHQVSAWCAAVARVLSPREPLLFEAAPRHVLDTWVMRTFTQHPREDRFEAHELAEELQRHGLHGPAGVSRHLGGPLCARSAVLGPAGSVVQR